MNNGKKAATARQSNDHYGENEQVVGGITITKVVQEQHLLVVGDGPFKSIGQLVDEKLAATAKENEVAQDIEIGFERKYWEEHLAPYYRSQ